MLAEAVADEDFTRSLSAFVCRGVVYVLVARDFEPAELVRVDELRRSLADVVNVEVMHDLRKLVQPSLVDVHPSGRE